MTKRYADATRNRDEPVWRAWYKTPQWRKLRLEVFRRDNYTCQRKGCGRRCVGKYPAEDSPVADHIKAHKGDAALFWNRNNLQTLCKSPCHDSLKQAEEASTVESKFDWYWASKRAAAVKLLNRGG